MYSLWSLYLLLLLSFSASAAPLSPPTIRSDFTGFQVNLNWTASPSATGYTFFYAPYPEMQPINQLEMGNVLQLSTPLNMGASFYIAVQAHNDTQRSAYSNIEHFIIPTTCRLWDEITIGDYLLSNNTWGLNKTLIADYKQCILADETQTEVKKAWFWHNANSDKIIAYPEIIYGHKPWNEASTTTQLPTQVQTIQKLTADYDYQLTAKGAYNLNFNLWFGSTPQAKVAEISANLIVVIEAQYTEKLGDYQGQLVINGAKYDFYHSLANGHTLALYPLSTKKTSSIDFNAIIQHLVKSNFIKSDHYLTAIEFGNSIQSGQGELLLNQYQINLDTQ